MYREMQNGFQKVLIGPPAELGGTDRYFLSLSDAQSYLTALVDDGSERVALRELVLHGGAPMMLNDDGVLADAAQRLLDGRLGVREVTRLPIGMLWRDSVTWLAPKAAAVPPQRPSMSEILSKFTVTEDTMVNWSPTVGGIRTGIKEKRMSATEARLVDGLGYDGQWKMKECAEQAVQLARAAYPARPPAPAWIAADQHSQWLGEDGHLDALRHSLWNALMTQELGEAFAESFATAHERTPDNQKTPARMAMDLWNNAQGRAIGRANPRATAEQLSKMLQQKIAAGDLLVIDAAGNLAWSDSVEVYKHGRVTPLP